MNSKSITTLCILAAGVITVFAQGTAFTYQGRLSSGSSGVTGLYDFHFAAYDTAANGTQIGNAVTANAVGVTNGLFTLTLDFGVNVFTGPSRWLDLAAKTNGSPSGFVSMTPRQPLTPAPYAVYAANANAVVNGAVGNAQISANAVQQTNLIVGGTPGAGKVISSDGNGLVWATSPTISGTWGTTGNSGTTAGANFIGTTDNQPLEIKASGVRAIRIEGNNVSAFGVSDGYTDPNLAPNIIAGAPYNYVNPGGVGSAVLSGGAGNFEAQVYSNYVSGNFSTIAGGARNSIQSPDTFSFDNFIGGGELNTVFSNSSDAFIGGGFKNSIKTNSDFAVIVGGQNNVINGQASFIGGGGIIPYQFGYTPRGNRITSDGAVLVGGAGNTIASGADFAFLGGGTSNLVAGLQGVVAGGWSNSVSASYGAVLGGDYNVASGFAAVVGGGDHNVNLGNAGTIAGGQNNSTANAYQPTVGGGYGNFAGSNYVTIAGGIMNTGVAYAATISGGSGNYASGPFSTVSGYYNQATNNGGVVAGGGLNFVGGINAAIPGGANNTANGDYSFAAGRQAKATNNGAFVWADNQAADFSSTASNQFSVRASGGVRLVTGGAGLSVDGIPFGGGYNTNTGDGATVAGGRFNAADDQYATVGGGQGNSSAGYASVGGGENNAASGPFATVAGGFGNIASGGGAFVGGGGYDGINFQGNLAGGKAAVVTGGLNNRATGDYTVVVGGSANNNSGAYSTIGGGVANTNSGLAATIPGGRMNLASGDVSFAAGNRAHATNTGAFVWADTQAVDFSSTSANQFLIRAAAGVGINTNNPQATLDVNGSLRVNAGTVITNLLAGQAAMTGGVSTSYTNLTITFPKTFSAAPRVVATVAADPIYDVSDTFVVSVRKVTTTNCVVNIVRVDSATGWSQSLRVNWIAWE